VLLVDANIIQSTAYPRATALSLVNANEEFSFVNSAYVVSLQIRQSQFRIPILNRNETNCALGALSICGYGCLGL